MDLDLSGWNAYAVTGAVASWTTGIAILAYHFIRLRTLGSDKERYDYVNRCEIDHLWRALLFLIFGGCLFGNSAIMEFSTLWIVVRAVLTVALGVVILLVLNHLLRFHYPFYMEKRLRKLRFRPRISPTGAPMRLLTEQEEDAYLDEGMLAEENIFSLDYDVWKDEESGFIKVEKYADIFMPPSARHASVRR